MGGFWKRWFVRHVNALSFWLVVIVVALALVLAARVVLPRGRGPMRAQPPSPRASPR